LSTKKKRQKKRGGRAEKRDMKNVESVQGGGEVRKGKKRKENNRLARLVSFVHRYHPLFLQLRSLGGESAFFFLMFSSFVFSKLLVIVEGKAGGEGDMTHGFPFLLTFNAPCIHSIYRVKPSNRSESKKKGINKCGSGYEVFFICLLDAPKV